MKTINIKLKVKDDIEAWDVVTKLGFKYQVDEVTYNGKNHKFNNKYKSKDFLTPKGEKIRGNK